LFLECRAASNSYYRHPTLSEVLLPRPAVVVPSLKSEPLAVFRAGSYYLGMAEAATQKQTYKTALAYFSGPRFHPFDSTDILAASESEAIDKAIEWSRNPVREVGPGTYLVVTIDGRSIHSEKLDWTNAPRP
jgi:hypothetical protein